MHSPVVVQSHGDSTMHDARHESSSVHATSEEYTGSAPHVVLSASFARAHVSPPLAASFDALQAKSIDERANAERA